MWLMSVSAWAIVPLLLIFYWPVTVVAALSFACAGWSAKSRKIKVVFWALFTLFGALAVIGMFEKFPS